MGALTDPMAWTDDAIGEIPGSVELKLVDVPDVGYFTDRKQPQGEIWIRGGSVTDGYLDLEKENKEAFTEDHWFKTGDIGEFDAKGHLRIIDRKKNLVKMQHGEYIALEKVRSLAARDGAVLTISSSSPSTAQVPLSTISVCMQTRRRASPSPLSYPQSPLSRSSLIRTASRVTQSRRLCMTRS